MRPPTRSVAIIAAALVQSACGPSNKYQPPPPPAVTVSLPIQAPVTDYLEINGTTAASRSVDLVARVPGYLREVAFSDGSSVKAGQLLFVIEPDQYQAKLQDSQAQLTNAQSEYDRQLRLIQQNATSQSNVEKFRAQREQAEAAVALARIDLGYTRVTAPFDGRIGRHLIDVGNLVGAGVATKLATVQQLEPMWVYASVNERDVLRIRSAQREHRIPQVQIGVTPIDMGLQDEVGYAYHGVIDFIDTDFDTATGTIQVRAAFANAERILLPGLFARLRVPLGAPLPGLLVPDRVLAADLAGSYVLLLGADDVVEQRRVTPGVLVQGKDGNLRQIIHGISAQDRIVVDGLQNAVPGNKVAPTLKPLAAWVAP